MQSYTYDRLGSILDQTGILSNNILYAGYQYDTETGLYYLNARMYDPVTARFMQEDTYAGEYNDPLSLNLYTYCKNEPIRYSDPTGHRYDEGDKSNKDEKKLSKAKQQVKNTQHKQEMMEKRTETPAKATAPTLSSVAKLTVTKVNFSSFCETVAISESKGTQYYNRSLSIPNYDTYIESQMNINNSNKNAFSLALGISVSVVNDMVVTPFVMITTENLKTLRHGGLYPDKQTQDINLLINSFYEVEGKVDSYFTDSGLINTAYYNKSRELGHYVTLATCLTSGFVGDIRALSATAESDMMYAANESITFTDAAEIAEGVGGDVISNPLALPATTISNPWMEGTELISRQAPKDYFINVAMSPGQTKPGAWGTVDTINDLNYARNNLAITLEFKGEISSVQKYLVPEGTWIQEDIAGQQTYKEIMSSGGANQTNILNFCDRSTLIPIGGRIPL